MLCYMYQEIGYMCIYTYNITFPNFCKLHMKYSGFVKHSKYYIPLQNFSIAIKILQVCLLISTLYSIHVPALYVCAVSVLIVGLSNLYLQYCGYGCVLRTSSILGLCA